MNQKEEMFLEGNVVSSLALPFKKTRWGSILIPFQQNLKRSRLFFSTLHHQNTTIFSGAET